VDIATLLKTANGGDGIQALAAAFDIDPSAARAAAENLATALSHRIERNTLSRGGVADIVELLGDEAGVDETDPAAPAVINAGNDALEVLTGSKHLSRKIAARAASESGIGVETAKQLLPAVASMMLNGLQRQTQPAFGRLMREVPDLRNLAMSRNGSPLPLPGEVPMDSGPSGDRQSNGGGRWGNDESSDDRQTQARPSRPISGGSPLPLPGDSIPGTGRGRGRQQDDEESPYNLPDVIRRGGVDVPGGGTLENVIRTILAGVLGFKNRGILGSLLQLFLINFLPRILKSIFGRVLGRR
jgi:Bacterial protein of unknown function (DUF937)